MKHPKYEGFIVKGMCSRQKKYYGITTIKRGNDYYFTWSFKTTEKALKSEHAEKNNVHGRIIHDEGFPGCPYCGRTDWVRCGVCGTFVCYDSEATLFECPACGNSGGISHFEEFDLSGSAL